MAKEFRFPDVGEGITEGEVVRWVVAEGRPGQGRPDPGRDRNGQGRRRDALSLRRDGPQAALQAQGHRQGRPGPRDHRARRARPCPRPERPRVPASPWRFRRPVAGVAAPPAAAPAGGPGDPGGPQARRRSRRRPGVACRGPDPEGGSPKRTSGPRRRRSGRSRSSGSRRNSISTARSSASRSGASGGRRPDGSPSPSGRPPTSRISTKPTRRRSSRSGSRLKPEAEAQGLKLTYLPFIVKAVVEALKRHPMLNSSLDDEEEEIIVKKYYNIGIAVDVPDGLIVPVVKGADVKTVFELAARSSRAWPRRPGSGRSTWPTSRGERSPSPTSASSAGKRRRRSSTTRKRPSWRR